MFYIKWNKSIGKQKVSNARLFYEQRLSIIFNKERRKIFLPIYEVGINLYLKYHSIAYLKQKKKLLITV